MNDTSDDQPAAGAEPQDDIVPGSLGAGPRDTHFGRSLGHRELRAGMPRLPRGGLVGMQRSGGLRFTSVAVVVLRDGRVRVARGVVDRWPVRSDEVRQLGDDAMATLLMLLHQSGVRRLHGETGRQSPDGYAYEIVARPGRRRYAVTVFTGAIPETLQPLITFLSTLLNETGE